MIIGGKMVNFNKSYLDLIYHGSWEESLIPSSWKRLPFEKIEENFDKIIASKKLDKTEVDLFMKNI
jgi:hypothetical protein